MADIRFCQRVGDHAQEVGGGGHHARDMLLAQRGQHTNLAHP